MRVCTAPVSKIGGVRRMTMFVGSGQGMLAQSDVLESDWCSNTSRY